MQDFLSLAQARWSCRSFSDEPISREELLPLLEAAAAAPTGHNYQPFHLWAITSDEAVSVVRTLSRCHFGAPAFVLVGADSSHAWTRPYDGFNVGVTDASIVATHLMLAAWDQGLGTCWVAHFNAPAFKEAFPEMRPYELVALFPVGHPAKDAAPLPLHERRASVDELTSWL